MPVSVLHLPHKQGQQKPRQVTMQQKEGRSPGGKGKNLVPPWPLLVFAGEGDIDDTHQVLGGDGAVRFLVYLHELLVLSCWAYRDDEAATRL